MKLLLLLPLLACFCARLLAQDGILGPFDTVERVSFGFYDSREEHAKRQYYTFAFSRNDWPPSKDYFFTLNNVKLEEEGIEEKMREAYRLGSEAIREFRTVPKRSPRGIENFISFSMDGQPAGISLSFWKGAYDENPKLLELQRLLESVIPKKENKPEKAMEPAPVNVTTCRPLSFRASRT